jgi:WD40 repeat protein
LPSGGGFGQSVSLSADGTRLISAGDGGGKASIGIYTLSGNAWTKSTTPDFGTGGRMGAVSISADGGTVAIGEIYFAGTAGNASGIVRLYDLP